MSKLNRLGAILLLVALVGVAWGGVTKIPSFVVQQTFDDCFSSGTGSLNYDASADGMAILNYAPGTDTTIVQVIVSDFSPGPLVINELIVSLGHDEGLDVGRFRIGAQGNGHFHGEMSGDLRHKNVTLWQEVDPPQIGCEPVLIATGG